MSLSILVLAAIEVDRLTLPSFLHCANVFLMCSIVDCESSMREILSSKP